MRHEAMDVSSSRVEMKSSDVDQALKLKASLAQAAPQSTLTRNEQKDDPLPSGVIILSVDNELYETTGELLLEVIFNKKKFSGFLFPIQTYNPMPPVTETKVFQEGQRASLSSRRR